VSAQVAAAVEEGAAVDVEVDRPFVGGRVALGTQDVGVDAGDLCVLGGDRRRKGSVCEPGADVAVGLLDQAQPALGVFPFGKRGRLRRRRLRQELAGCLAEVCGDRQRRMRGEVHGGVSFN
jgi:hypothetical protein